ncbi:MAG TPA: tripartite tricarboxylate transporter substrate binding protein [Steroidobacteraceae bacterium]|jgi:tripartite-type tricarboxylate transporter receptor subunit TctC|nr:tripartite tricarboxylate transporter substrate binding protein [Steroidobacteraceae bacterium]
MTKRCLLGVLACGMFMAALAIAVLGLQREAHAQAYPERTVRIIVPTAPGGSIDTTARVVAGKLAELWGKPVVIENRAGAAMIIGTEAAAKAAPDGYTLLVAHDGTMAMNPVVYPNLGYHSQRDFEPVALLTSIPEVVLVNEGVPAKSIKELVALAKAANPGKLNHASGGTATLLALELFKAMAGVDITSIPFRGGAPAVTGVMSGDTQLIFADLATANAGMQSGKLRTLAVTTLKRAPRLPDVPTVDESGVPGYDVATWIGAFAPAGTPKSIVGKIEADIKQTLAAPEVKAKLEALSMEIRSGASEEMRAVLAGDMGKWGRLVKDRNIQIAQ